MSKITESARMEFCTLRIKHICNFNVETTVWAHANGSAAGKGIGMKSHDLLGAYACSAQEADAGRGQGVRAVFV